MDTSNYARILNMSKSAEIYPNVGKYASIYLTFRDRQDFECTRDTQGSECA